MKTNHIIFAIASFLIITLFSGSDLMAQDSKASTDDVYNLILKAVPVLEQLGEEGLAAFNDPKGEFVYKDAYVLVIDCSTMTMVAHPAKQMVGVDISNSKDKNPDPAKVKQHGHEMCALSKRPSGGWLEYYWNVLGTEEVARKVGFAIGVPGTSYALVSTIYNDTADIDQLNASLN